MEELEQSISNMNQRKKYLRIYDYLKIFIDQNKFTLNNKLPSENFLCGKFSVSRETVRMAMKLLMDEGLVYSRKGSGTYFDKYAAISAPDIGDTDKTRIAFITQGRDYNTSSNLVRGIKQALDRDSVELKIFMTDNKLSNERKCLESCYSGYDGLIVDGVKASIMNPNLDCYSYIDKKNIPIIFFNNYYMGTHYPRVIIDDAACADGLIRRLTEKGHKHIAGIFMYDNYQGQEKYNGFMKSLIKYGAEFRDDYVKWCISDESYDKKSFPLSLWHFLKKLPKVTAVVCCNYMILNMMLELFEEKGISVPRDYSIVGFDYSCSDWPNRGITASIHPGFDMGVYVGDTILQMVEDNNFRKRDYSYVFPPNIFDGTSVKDLNRQ